MTKHNYTLNPKEVPGKYQLLLVKFGENSATTVAAFSMTEEEIIVVSESNDDVARLAYRLGLGKLTKQ